MSLAVAETTLLGMDAINRGDVEAFVALSAPDIHWEPLRAPVTGAYEGHDGLRAWYADTQENFDRFRIDSTEMRVLADGKSMLSIGTLHVRGRGSGIETDVPAAPLSRFEDGLLTDFKDHSLRAAGLEAAGLDPEPDDGVALVRQAYDAYARGDDATFQGHQGWLDAVGAWRAEFDEWSMEAAPLIGFENQVIVREHQIGRGGASGVPVESDCWLTYTLEGGKIARIEIFPRREQAFEAARA